MEDPHMAAQYGTSDYGLAHLSDQPVPPYVPPHGLFGDYYHHMDHNPHGAPPPHQYHDYAITPYYNPEMADFDNYEQMVGSYGWGWSPYDPYHVDPRHSLPPSPYYPGYYLDQQDVDEDQLLALYGAKELFQQLGEHKRPSTGHKRRHRRSRQNGDSDTDSDGEQSTDESSDNPVHIPQMNLFGASELFD